MTPMDPFSFGGFSQSQYPCQIQYQQHHYAMHMQMQVQSQGVQIPSLLPFTQTAPEHDFISLAVDNDVTPETQPQTTNTKKGGKRAIRYQEKGSGRAKSIPWIPDKLEALARVWVKASTDPILGHGITRSCMKY
ncbi:uncharacterized protein LOC118482029 [Helianthus annuus]|uniref:uncharacterized protein LOC118482029 n=1 Tax=Helianthus annuus TaxID=4232 RepID=UPI0016530B8F|nr:uncharacterized protein LOC118482029 [Helianthus annuus]